MHLLAGQEQGWRLGLFRLLDHAVLITLDGQAGAVELVDYDLDFGRQPIQCEILLHRRWTLDFAPVHSTYRTVDERYC